MKRGARAVSPMEHDVVGRVLSRPEESSAVWSIRT